MSFGYAMDGFGGAMTMEELQTLRPTMVRYVEYLATEVPPERQADAQAVVKGFRDISGIIALAASPDELARFMANSSLTSFVRQPSFTALTAWFSQRCGLEP